MEKKTTEANAESIVTPEEVRVLPPTEEDLEAKVLALEAEKALHIEEAANYKMAYLKEKSKKTEFFEDESEEDRLRRITREEIANSRLSQIDRDKDEIYKKALRENKELKLAQLNRTGTPPASLGTHTEGYQVKDTLVTPEQLTAFKARGWSDKDIEKYKRNLQKRI